MKLADAPVFFLDLQTTGSRPGESDILEMAWGSIEDSELIAKPTIESVLIHPSTGFVPRRIQQLTGITEDDMLKAVSLQIAFDRLSRFLKPLGEKPWAIIHFAQFEKPFLLHAYQLLQQELPFELVCTHKIAKRLMPNLPAKGIRGLAGYYGYKSGEFKRSASHVAATRCIWNGVILDLKEKNIHSSSELLSWLEEKPAAKPKKYEYPLPKEMRLGLPDQPGVYRMLSRWGEVLYVGKATSLHSRVNSYFRGQKNRDPRKLEMLTQTWNLEVTPVATPLEAALLETDEIKRLNPRYNISLKAGNRAFVFFNRTFTLMSYRQDDKHSIGPFSNPMVMDSMLNLSEGLRSGQFSPTMFFDPIDSELLQEGFAIFCERHQLYPQDFTSVRSILAVGLRWHRNDLKRAGKVADIVDAELTSPEDVLELTADDIADKFERHFIRAARAYARARQLTNLLNADIDFKIPNSSKIHVIKVRKGQLLSLQNEALDITEDITPDITEDNACQAEWRGLSIDTYDRMSILMSELAKIKSHDGTVLVRKCTQN